MKLAGAVLGLSLLFTPIRVSQGPEPEMPKGIQKITCQVFGHGPTRWGYRIFGLCTDGTVMLALPPEGFMEELGKAPMSYKYEKDI